MTAVLKKIVQPFLRSSGFKGSFPHYRRIGAEAIDLLTFQFNRHGGSFVIEVARCGTDGIMSARGLRIPPDETRAWDIHPNYRTRIEPAPGNAGDKWFCFDAQSAEKVAGIVLQRLTEYDLWGQLPVGLSRPYSDGTPS